MNKRLRNKVAIVTGAASGIGRAIAATFAREGARVVLDDINEKLGRLAVKQIRKAGGEAMFVKADVSKPAQVKAMVARTLRVYGGVDVLVNNAFCGVKPVLENNLDVNVNVILRGAWNCNEAVIPHMKKQGRGAIIHISSVNALLGIGEVHAYSAVKGGLISMGRALANTLGKHQIRVNTICPGTVETEAFGPLLKKDPDMLKKIAPMYPLQRIARSEDVANAALWVASDEASYVTGIVLPVDGGLTAGIPRWGW